MRAQRLQHGHVAGTRRQRQSHAVVGIGPGVEQRLDERQRPRDARGAPQHGPVHIVMQPGKARVGIDAERDELARDRGQTSRPISQCRIADVVDRLPVTRPARLAGK